MWTYFVSYAYANEQVSGFGNLTMTCAQPIRGADEIRAIQAQIAAAHDLEGVTILWFTVLSGVGE